MKLLLLLFNFQQCSPDILKKKLSQRTTAFPLRQSDSVTVVRLFLMTFFLFRVSPLILYLSSQG